MLAIATAERGTFAAKPAAGSSFGSIDDLGDTTHRVGFNKQVNVIRHDLDGMKRHAVFAGDLGEHNAFRASIGCVRTERRYFGRPTM